MANTITATAEKCTMVVGLLTLNENKLAMQQLIEIRKTLQEVPVLSAMADFERHRKTWVNNSSCNHATNSFRQQKSLLS